MDQIVTREHFKLGQLSIAAAHLMGGCRMGENVETSVTDSWGRVHGMKDVYVADSSLFPGPSEVNPYLTIMALADRVAQGIRRDLGVDS
ncbi:GMC family oxidoreductase [Bdellovibrionota bacterium FG-2]